MTNEDPELSVSKTILALLSERSELLAAVERMRGSVTGLLSFMGQLTPTEFVAALYWHNTPGLELTTREELEANLNTAIAAAFASLVAIDAALTTGEGK